jgi:hypothetical protein
VYRPAQGLRRVLNNVKAALKERVTKDGSTRNPVKEREGNEEFREHRRRKRNSSDDGAKKKLINYFITVNITSNQEVLLN